MKSDAASRGEPCSAYRRGEPVCRNGFFQTSVICSGMPNGCPLCGKPSDRLPNCLREDLPAHWLTDSGLPAFVPKEHQS